MPHYFLLDAPVASPAKCVLCGYSGADRKYLDPRLDFEFYGSAIFCEACVGTMANDFGFHQPAQARALEARAEEAERELIILRAAVADLENVHDAFNRISAFNSVNSIDTLAPDSSARIEELHDEAINDEGPGDSASDDIVSEPRPDDLSDAFAEFGKLKL